MQEEMQKQYLLLITKDNNNKSGNHFFPRSSLPKPKTDVSISFILVVKIKLVKP